MKSHDFIVVDAHVHTYPSREIGRRAVGEFGYGYWGTIPELNSVMKAAGVAQAVMSSLVPVKEMQKAHLAKMPQGLGPDDEKRFTADTNEKMMDRLHRRNLWACETSRENPGLGALICVDVLQDPRQMAAEVRERVDKYWAKGLKIHPNLNEHYGWDQRLWPAYAAAQEIGAPVMIHSGVSMLPGYDSRYARVAGFGKVAEAFPDLTIVLAHLGKDDHEVTVKIAEEHPNVFFDTACSFIHPKRPREELAEEVLALIRKIGAQRVMFGSDWPWHDPHADIDVIKNMDLTRKEKQMVLGENAQRIYKM